MPLQESVALSFTNVPTGMIILDSNALAHIAAYGEVALKRRTGLTTQTQ